MGQSDLLLPVLILTLAVNPGAQAADSTPTAESIVKKSVELAAKNFDRGKDYTFLQRVEQAQLEKDGRVKKRESETFDVLNIAGTQYQKKIAENDKPLSGKDLEKANREFEKELQERKDESESDRKKRLDKARERRQEMAELLAEIPKAYDLRLVGEEMVDGVRAWVIDAKPRAGYKPKGNRQELLTKMEGRFWIDENEYQWVKVEARTIAPVSFGWVLARVAPGSVLTFRQGRVNSEIWLPQEATMRLDARLALLKSLRTEVKVGWKEYRKFQSDSRIVSTEELVEEKR